MAVDVDAADRLLADLEAETPIEDCPDEPSGLADAAHDDEGVHVGAVGARRRARNALGVSLAMVVAVAGLTGWLGYRSYQLHHEQSQRNLYLRVARQAALNLTTISYTEAESDVQRIIDSATGTFRDDFTKRSQPFIDVVKQAQSKSQGAITEAALESEDGNSARALLAVTVNTSLAGVAEQQPRAWRMRIAVQKVGEDVKVSNVEFVP